MATVEVRGYANKPEVKMSAGGKPRVTFNLGVKQKQNAYGGKPESVTWANFAVTQFGATEAPAEKSFVTVKGYLNVREFEHNGVKRQSLDITATELDVAAPFSDAAELPAKAGGKSGIGKTVTAAKTKEPWDE